MTSARTSANLLSDPVFCPGQLFFFCALSRQILILPGTMRMPMTNGAPHRLRLTSALLLAFVFMTVRGKDNNLPQVKTASPSYKTEIFQILTRDGVKLNTIVFIPLAGGVCVCVCVCGVCVCVVCVCVRREKHLNHAKH